MGFVKNESFDGESLDHTTKLLAGISGRVSCFWYCFGERDGEYGC